MGQSAVTKERLDAATRALAAAAARGEIELGPEEAEPQTRISTLSNESGLRKLARLITEELITIAGERL